MRDEVFFGAGAIAFPFQRIERAQDEATAHLLGRMLGRIGRRTEAEFIGLPAFLVIRDCMGRPCRLEAL